MRELTTWLPMTLAGLCAAAACGDNSPGNPGTIAIRASGITGGTGKLPITEARIDGRQAAVSCIPIEADPFTTTAVLEEIVGATPCEESNPITLDGGLYAIRSVVQMGGAPAPELCANGEITVNGD